MVIQNKKGAELTIGTIIVIVLGVAVLVFLIWGFGTGWSNLWGKVMAYTGGGSNIDTVKQACALACNGMQENDYCYNVRDVTLADKTKIKGTCATLSSSGIESCSSLSCKTCSGVSSAPCTDVDQSDCNKVNVCLWNTTTSTCVAKDCSTLLLESQCTSSINCIWN